MKGPVWRQGGGDGGQGTGAVARHALLHLHPTRPRAAAPCHSLSYYALIAYQAALFVACTSRTCRFVRHRALAGAGWLAGCPRPTCCVGGVLDGSQGRVFEDQIPCLKFLRKRVKVGMMGRREWTRGRFRQRRHGHASSRRRRVRQTAAAGLRAIVTCVAKTPLPLPSPASSRTSTPSPVVSYGGERARAWGGRHAAAAAAANLGRNAGASHSDPDVDSPADSNSHLCKSASLNVGLWLLQEGANLFV